jgi:hypothetical protein
MKRIIATSFLFTYLLVISGMAFSFHYCGSKLSSFKVELVKEKPNTCACGAKKEKSCCHNIKVIAKIADTNKTPALTYKIKVSVVKLFVTEPRVSANKFSLNLSSKFGSLYANAPPNKHCNELFLLNCTFRI